MSPLVSLVLVSHSRPLAEGLSELVGQMVGGAVRIEVVAGLPSGELGTSQPSLRQTLKSVAAGGAVVIADLGSAVLTTKQVLAEDAPENVVLADAPLVEGAVAAAVLAAGGAEVGEVVRAAEGARDVRKL